MSDKNRAARTLLLLSRGNLRRSATIAAVVMAAAFFFGGCDGGDSPQGPYQPGIVYDNGGPPYEGGYSDDDYTYDDGGIAPDRFDPQPPPGPYSPGVDSPYN